MKRFACLAALTLSGCGLINTWDGEDDIYGAHLYVRIKDPVLAARFSSNDPAFRKQLHDAIWMAASYHHVSPYIVKGWRIILQDWEVEAHVAGYTDGFKQNVTIDVRDGCDIFHGVMAHEMLHIKKWNPPFENGDADHSDSEWLTCDWNELWWMANEASVDSNMYDPTSPRFDGPWCTRDAPWPGQWRGGGWDLGTCSGEKPSTN